MMDYDAAARKLGISRAEVLRKIVDNELRVEHVGRDRQPVVNADEVERLRGRK